MGHKAYVSAGLLYQLVETLYPSPVAAFTNMV